MPRAFAPPGAASTTDEVLGHALVTDLAAGEAVTATRVGTRAGPIAVLLGDDVMERGHPLLGDML
ncbi:MAG: SAF domain-containing protein, partial [Actinomycetota bacterium]